MDSCAYPPNAARVAEVVLVDCQRGQGDLRRSVLQVWSKDGELLAEHDRIHADPVYPAFFLRDRLPDGWLEIMGQGGDEPERVDTQADMAPSPPASAGSLVPAGVEHEVVVARIAADQGAMSALGLGRPTK